MRMNTILTECTHRYSELKLQEQVFNIGVVYSPLYRGSYQFHTPLVAHDNPSQTFSQHGVLSGEHNESLCPMHRGGEDMTHY